MKRKKWVRKLGVMFPINVDGYDEKGLMHEAGCGVGHAPCDGELLACEAEVNLEDCWGGDC
ncbi:hypothetical protein GOP47_0013886 [Adiantum capillus-veneris]|uniref:Uncharacterized protein n=1 Tax=Adiantum capillus-veneris TaxID=13818 RepID=A0A9D4ZFT8_ADICA|nr:hypothetical protein GOP47_0013886 [Adiantum capillus-veneris]